MKILYIITAGEQGGAQKNVFDLAVGARQMGYKVTVATGRQDTVTSRWLFDELRASGFRSAVPARRVGVRAASTPRAAPDLVIVPALRRAVRPLHDVVAFFQIRRLVRELRPDIVHLHSSKAGSIGSLAAKLAWTRTKVVYTVHGFVTAEPLSWKAKLFYWCSEYIASFFRDLVITVSAWDEAFGRQEKLIHSSSVVIYNGLDQVKKAGILSFSQAREVLGRLLPEGVTLASNQRVIGVIANFYRTKGITYLLDAIALLRSSARENGIEQRATVILIGDGELRAELEAKVHTLNLSEQVFFLGSVDDAYRYLSAFDFIVLPSIKEGFPYVLLEALLAGRPFIATRVGGIPELVDSLPVGVVQLVPPASATALAAAIAKFLLESPPAAVRLPELFNLEHQRAATFAEYKRLLA